jgi:serine/threonine protein phosphatase 1
VIDRILALKTDPRVSVHALRGNHDQYVLDFFETPEIGMTWLDYGGAATLLSYGVVPPLTRTDAAAWKPVAEALKASMPPEHVAFLETASLSATLGDYVFAHAGVRPEVELEDQTPSDLLTIRKPFLKSRDPLPGRVVVFGHTPVERPAVKEGKMGVDTGAYATGVLTAARIYEDQVDFIQT